MNSKPSDRKNRGDDRSEIISVGKIPEILVNPLEPNMLIVPSGHNQ